MDLNKQKEAILKIRAEYTDLLNETRGRDKNDPMSEAAGSDSSVPTNDADVATETFERERDMAFDSDYTGAIEQMDRALAKIEDGTYGICDMCGERIPDERLEAFPYAVLCTKDQEIQEGL